MQKPDGLKNIKIVAVYDPKSKDPDKRRYCLKNTKDETIVPDTVPKEYVQYIADLINTDGARRKIQIKDYVTFVMPGEVKLKRDSRKLIEVSDGKFVLKNTKEYEKWIAYHIARRRHYVGNKSIITYPCTVKCIFIVPDDPADYNLSEYLVSMVHCLYRCKIIGSQRADVVKSFDGSRIERNNKYGYGTVVTISRWEENK